MTLSLLDTLIVLVTYCHTPTSGLLAYTNKIIFFVVWNVVSVGVGLDGKLRFRFKKL